MAARRTDTQFPPILDCQRVKVFCLDIHALECAENKVHNTRTYINVHVHTQSHTHTKGRARVGRS